MLTRSSTRTVTLGVCALIIVVLVVIFVGWAIHGSENGWHSSTGDYAATVELLIAAGCCLPERTRGSEAVREVLRRHEVNEP